MQQERIKQAFEVFERFATDLYTLYTVFEVWARTERFGDAFLPAVIAALQFYHDDVASLAVQVVEKHIEMTANWKSQGLCDTIPSIIRLLERDATREVAMRTLAAFGMEAKSALPMLSHFFNADDTYDSVIAADAILAIEVEQRDKVVPFLLEVLGVEEAEPMLHHIAIDALGRLGSHGLHVVPVLEKLLDGENACEASLSIFRITGNASAARRVGEQLFNSDDRVEQAAGEEHLEEIEDLIDRQQSGHDEFPRRRRWLHSNRRTPTNEGSIAIELKREVTVHRF